MAPPPPCTPWTFFVCFQVWTEARGLTPTLALTLSPVLLFLRLPSLISRFLKAKKAKTQPYVTLTLTPNPSDPNPYPYPNPNPNPIPSPNPNPNPNPNLT